MTKNRLKDICGDQTDYAHRFHNPHCQGSIRCVRQCHQACVSEGTVLWVYQKNRPFYVRDYRDVYAGDEARPFAEGFEKDLSRLLTNSLDHGVGSPDQFLH